jgi:hypothetical protein
MSNVAPDLDALYAAADAYSALGELSMKKSAAPRPICGTAEIESDGSTVVVCAEYEHVATY